MIALVYGKFVIRVPFELLLRHSSRPVPVYTTVYISLPVQWHCWFLCCYSV